MYAIGHLPNPFVLFVLTSLLCIIIGVVVYMAGRGGRSAS